MKIKSGQMMLGLVIQYVLDNYRHKKIIKPNDFCLYCDIARRSFGFRKKYAYIEQSYFNMDGKTLKKSRDKLVELDLIVWKKTDRNTMYMIIEPKEIIDNFIFIGSIKSTKGGEKDDENTLESIV